MRKASNGLTLESKGELGECRRECNTIAHACRAPVTLVMQSTFPEMAAKTLCLPVITYAS